MKTSLLQRAGELVREHVHAPEPERSAAALRANLLNQWTRSRHRGVLVRRLALASGMFVTLALIVLWWARPTATQGQPIAFTVGPNHVAGVVGAYVTPPSSDPLELAFSEGSSVALLPGTRARVAETSVRGAVVVVETGRAAVRVVHRLETDWRVLAGPYSLTVIGTTFEVAFEPDSQTLAIDMEQGAVRVSGPGLSSPVEIRGSSRFVHSVGKAPARAAASTARAPDPAAVLGARSAGSPQAGGNQEAPPSAASAPKPPASAASTAPPSAVEDWSSLSARGEYRQVVQDATAKGLDSVLASAGVDELMALGKAGRYSGRADLADRAYRAVRSRYPGSEPAAAAAFLLGRMSESGNPAAALGWYDRYVAEAPGGRFVAEAMGRRMIALKNSGNTDGAQRAAEAYLERFPAGPYAGVAREMAAP